MSECYQNTYRNSSYYHASDDDLYISNVPEKEFTKSSNAKKEIHVVPSEIKKNYDNPDENIQKLGMKM
ncbi:unnamed protein product [Brachionus calyciflorus]|uniref:Uncharacterized protein n=1 Tax=Brachionus calyciflorus TaxID=104777 RepID=A0A814QFF7_9BILA|nr:unnamed protein product [Brachionus calyciflorus]